MSGEECFLYLDPYGLKVMPFYIFEAWSKARYASIELLMNFNSSGFRRWASCVYKRELLHNDYCETKESSQNCHMLSSAAITTVAGGDYWRDVAHLADLFDSEAYPAELKLVRFYKSQLLNLFKYVLDIPVRDKKKGMPKYRMIHATNHVDGCYLIAENMQKRSNELALLISKQRSLPLFEEEARCIHEECTVSDEQVQNYVQELLAGYTNPVELKHFLVDFSIKYGLINDFNAIIELLKKMECNNKLVVTRSPRITDKGRQSHFWSVSSSKKVFFKLR